MSGQRRVSIRTTHDDPAVVAAAVTPDNTDEMTTAVDAETVTTTITRDSTGGLQATVDDYLVNLHVAAQCTNDKPHNTDT